MRRKKLKTKFRGSVMTTIIIFSLVKVGKHINSLVSGGREGEGKVFIM